MKKSALIIFLALCGCEATQSDREKTLPVALHTEQRTVPLMSDGRFEEKLLKQAMVMLGGQTEISADIVGLMPERTEQIMSRLAALGLEPDRVHVAPMSGDYQVVRPILILSRTQVALPDCTKIMRSGWLGDVTPSIENMGRCVQNNNLAQMLADPSDLYRAPVGHPSSAERAALGVRRLNEGQDKTLPSDALGNGLAGSGLSGAGMADGSSATESQLPGASQL